MKLGVFGGTFNPPHIAHCILTEYLLDDLNLDKILIVPSYISPHKIDNETLSPESRYELTGLAFEANPRVEVSRLEIERGGKSYTIDTLRELQKVYRSPEIFLIMGIDNLIGFSSWREYRAILDLCTVVAMNRPGFNVEEVEPGIMGRITVVTVPHLEISSTDIRQRLGKKKSVKYLLPDAVEKEIIRKGYYLR
jgi:nicotinate-nucleotide adenylyltransferase